MGPWPVSSLGRKVPLKETVLWPGRWRTALGAGLRAPRGWACPHWGRGVDGPGPSRPHPLSTASPSEGGEDHLTSPWEGEVLRACGLSPWSLAGAGAGAEVELGAERRKVDLLTASVHQPVPQPPPACRKSGGLPAGAGAPLEDCPGRGWFWKWGWLGQGRWA